MRNRYMHIVLIGLNFSLQRHSGDKNFWIELLPLLATHLNRITIFSIRENRYSAGQYLVNDCRVLVRYFPPKFLEIGDVKRVRIFWRRGAFPSRLAVIEKALNGKRICKELKKLYEEDPYDYVHLMDNFGFANRVIAKSAPTPVSVSAMAYQGKNNLIYNRYLFLSYNHPNLVVVPYSSPFAKKLGKIGIDRAQIKCIHWGVPVVEKIRWREGRKKAKKSLGLPEDKPLIVWAGYIQQIQRKDFLFAVNVAEKMQKQGVGAVFYFAFKQEHFEKDFVTFHKPDKLFYVKPTTTEEFNILKHATDIFYSPVVNKNCILAPPLTWIEFLNLGVPILTTNIPGADEIISNKKTGYLVDSQEELIKKLSLLIKEYGNFIPYCYEKVSSAYNIKNAAEQYLNLWEGK